MSKKLVTIKVSEEVKKRREMLTRYPEAQPIVGVFSTGFLLEPNLAKMLFKLLLEKIVENGVQEEEKGKKEGEKTSETETRVTLDQRKHLDLSTIYYDMESCDVILSCCAMVPYVCSGTGGPKMLESFESPLNVLQNILNDLVKLAGCNPNASAKWGQLSQRVAVLIATEDKERWLEKTLCLPSMGSIDPKNSDLHENPNVFIAKKIEAVGKLRKLQGDSTSETAHRNAAYAIKNHSTPIKSFADAVKIKGVGPKIAAKIDEILDTGTLSILEDKSEAERVMELFQTIWGVGPEHARQWFEAGCKSIADLKAAVDAGQIKLNRNQKVCFDCREDLMYEMQRSEMEELHRKVVECLEAGESGGKGGNGKGEKKGTEKSVSLPFVAEIVGSYRRGKQSSKDVDVLIYPKKGEACNRMMMQRVCRIIGDSLGRLMTDCVVGESGRGGEGENQEATKTKETEKQQKRGYHELALGNKKLECIINLGKGWRRLDVFVTTLESLPCAYMAFTGPADFNRKCRELAQKKGWLLNEMNLYDERGDVVETKSEEDVFERLGLKYLTPGQRK